MKDDAGYDPGAGLSEASAFEERMDAGWYDDPPEDDDELEPVFDSGPAAAAIVDALDGVENELSMLTGVMAGMSAMLAERLLRIAQALEGKP